MKVNYAKKFKFLAVLMGLIISSYGAGHPNYPYYDPSEGFSSSFNTDKTQIYCTFYCVKYLSEYIIDGVYYTIPVKFYVNGGNIYPGT